MTTRLSKSSATSARLPAAIRSARAMSIGSPASSSSPVRTISISALANVPAACIARRAASITTIPPLLSFAPGPTALLPSRVNFWKGELGSNTVSRWPISSIFLPLNPEPVEGPLRVAMICPERPAAAIGTQRTSKPNVSSSARIICPTFSTPSMLSDPLFWFTSRSSKATDRSCSASTLANIFASGFDSRAAAGAAIASAIAETIRI